MEKYSVVRNEFYAESQHHEMRMFDSFDDALSCLKEAAKADGGTINHHPNRHLPYSYIVIWGDGQGIDSYILVN